MRLADRSTRIIPGIGPKTAERLRSLGAGTIGALQQLPEELLVSHFGVRHGAELHRRAFLHDDSPVVVERELKSRSTETTFDVDVVDIDRLQQVIGRMAEQLASGLRRSSLRARTVGIKVRLDDWTTVTRVRTLPAATDDARVLNDTAARLLAEYAPARPVRLVGVRVATFMAADAPDRPSRSSAVPVGQLALEV